MKRMIIVLLCIATMFSFFAFSVNATEVDFVPYVVRLEITEGTVNKSKIVIHALQVLSVIIVYIFRKQVLL